MQIVIEMSDDDYKRIKDMPDAFNSLTSRAYKAIKNGKPLPKGHGRLIDADKVENITWQNPNYADAWNVLTEIRDKVRELPTIIEADKEEAYG